MYSCCMHDQQDLCWGNTSRDTSEEPQEPQEYYYMAYPKSGTQDPGLRTRDPYVGPGTLHLRPFAWDPGPGAFTWDPRPGTLHLGPITWDPRPYMWDPIKKTHFVYQSTVFLCCFNFILQLRVQHPVSYYCKMI